MSKPHDAVVVGAGVVGASCAYHFARAGMRVLVVERARGPGEGSTGRATGGFRAQFGTAINIRLSLLARERLRVFRDETGVDPGVAEVGYLWLAPSLDGLARANELQRREGLTEARLVDVDAIRELNPHVDLAGIRGGAWCPTDGVLRPLDVTRGYLDAAVRLGAEVRYDADVVGIERDAVVTADASYPTGLVVDAAGPWAAAVARLAGVDLPVTPLRRQVAITEPTTALPATMPLTIWLADGFHARVRDDRALLLMPSSTDGTTDGVEPAWLDRIAALAAERVPPLRGVGLDRARAWAGFYEVSPDRHAILGFATERPSLLLVNGSSGHGVMHAPALGLLAAEIATGRPTSLDVHALRPSRFAEGQSIADVPLL